MKFLALTYCFEKRSIIKRCFICLSGVTSFSMKTMYSRYKKHFWAPIAVNRYKIEPGYIPVTARCVNCSKLTKKNTPERPNWHRDIKKRWLRCDVFSGNFEKIPHLFSGFYCWIWGVLPAGFTNRDQSTDK